MKLTAVPAMMAGTPFTVSSETPLWDIYQNGCRCGSEYASSPADAVSAYVTREHSEGRM